MQVINSSIDFSNSRPPSKDLKHEIHEYIIILQKYNYNIDLWRDGGTASTGRKVDFGDLKIANFYFLKNGFQSIIALGFPDRQYGT